MSQSFSLVCDETQKAIWVGQGHSDETGGMETFYCGEETTMRFLKKFLNDHKGKTLRFICNDDYDDKCPYCDKHIETVEYEDYET